MSNKIASAVKVGCCKTHSHHGEILQGVFEQGENCRLSRGLLTLPCPEYSTTARFYPDQTDGVIIEAGGRLTQKAQKAAQLTLKKIVVREGGGRLVLSSNIPLGGGCGSSTSDVVATIKAIADAYKKKLSTQDIACLAITAEQASDSIMFEDRAILFAHREGSIIEDFHGPLPPLYIVGVNTNELGVDTLSFPAARYNCLEIEQFRVLRGALRRAIAYQDPQLIGRIASASARINQRFLPKPRLDCFINIVEQVGALGLQVAHSGTVVGLIFDPNDRNNKRKIRTAQKHLANMGFGKTFCFGTINNYTEVAAA
jgi:uncharacterized protein involved in propanediol utilization